MSKFYIIFTFTNFIYGRLRRETWKSKFWKLKIKSIWNRIIYDSCQLLHQSWWCIAMSRSDNFEQTKAFILQLSRGNKLQNLHNRHEYQQHIAMTLFLPSFSRLFICYRYKILSKKLKLPMTLPPKLKLVLIFYLHLFYIICRFFYVYEHRQQHRRQHTCLYDVVIGILGYNGQRSRVLILKKNWAYEAPVLW